MKFLSLLLLVFMTVGCQSNYQTVTQADDSIAYVQLSGNFWGTELIIDDNAPIVITEGKLETFKLDGKEVIKFELGTGSHRIKVLRAGKLVVDRKIYVSDGNTFEVVVK
ncbi:hypothetical protein [Aliiglaciecola litoralis]|uniref:DUF2846 domain-containing protein n=1 Tax=Aliiglaciecola litoralis TaxID=582857 RepID=A0ABP3X1X4_9ALTE